MSKERSSREFFGGWPGHEHIRYSGDYHVNPDAGHLPLEELAEEVAKRQQQKSKG